MQEQSMAVRIISCASKVIIYWAKFALCISLISSGRAEQVTVTDNGWAVSKMELGDPTIKSMIQLISNPELYDGKLIKVVGVLSVEEEDHRLYLSKEFYDLRMSQYAVLLNFPAGAEKFSERFQGKYVLLRGKFKLERVGSTFQYLNVKSISLYDEHRETQIGPRKGHESGTDPN